MTTVLYTRRERAALVAALRKGDAPHCPRCGRPMERGEVRPREGVAYVRRRIWLVCGGCARSLVVDRRKVDAGTGGPPA